MKIILNNESKDTINIDEITKKHLVVAVIQGDPHILNKGFYETTDRYCFGKINGHFTIGNGHSYSQSDDSIQKMVKKVIEVHNGKVEAFHESDWKKALQWLIDNA